MNNISRIIESRSKFGIKLGLDNVKQVLNELDNPQESLKIIHIAGTNGKGSVSSIISKCLEVDGNTVSKYCSPYLINLNEMFVINDNLITNEELEQYYKMILKAENKTNIELTLYEVTTVIMFLYSKCNKVDYLVLEVGLGGRLDATNVVNPLVSIITNISLDHTAILGDTIEEIAIEKAGIIKPEVPLYTSETNEQALSVFKSKTSLCNQINTNVEYRLDYSDFKTEIFIGDEAYALNLFGVHQVSNFMLAKAVLDFLNIPVSSIKIGSAKVIHNGRLEKISNNTIFDGAHNIASAKMLVESMKNCEQEINIVFSILKDKDILGVVRELKKLSSNLTFVPLDELERGMSISDMQKYAIDDINYAPDINSALDNNMLNLVCGSFSLYSKLRS